MVSPYVVARTLSVMTSSGMYDFAGEWMYRVGIPAKSGVGGGILAALLRDDLDENGGGDLDFEAAAGSGVMIVADLQLCKFFRRRC